MQNSSTFPNSKQSKIVETMISSLLMELRPRSGSENREALDKLGRLRSESGSVVQVIRIKRIYEQPSKEDGFRVLVERLWPRGMSKDKAKIDARATTCSKLKRCRREA